MYYDSAGTVIYVGKAKNLRRRVSSYFNRTHDVMRTNILVRNIADMSYIVVPTEQDALNLENSMIKEYQPRYNVLLKDDKSYPWIAVTNEMYPRVFLTRQHIKDGTRYFGPYTNTGVARTVLDLIGKLYPVRTCRLPITPDYIAKGKGRLCLQYHIKKCRGCCTGAIDRQTYAGYIERIRQILRGETGELLAFLKERMQELAAELRFEEAQELKEKYRLLENYRSKSVIVSQTVSDVDVFGFDDDGSNDVYINYMHVRRGAVVRSVTLRYRRSMAEERPQLLGYAMEEIRQSVGAEFGEVIVEEPPEVEMPGVTFTIPRRGDKAKLLEVSARNARQNRLDDLKHLERHNPEERTSRLLERIKADFRLSELPRHIECFDNSNIQGTNPVASCVVFRDGKPAKRDYRHFNIKTVVGPDDMGLRGTIAVVGIAKRLEEIYFPGDSVPLYIDKNSETLRVVQHLRDEAHRFGITHHRNRRSRNAISSELDSIKGIGPATAAALLAEFKSVQRLPNAAVAQIAAVAGPAKAALVVAGLGKDTE